MYLFDEKEIVQWLSLEGCVKAHKERTLSEVYESLPWTSKMHLLKLLRERRKRCLEKESLDPVFILSRRWNVERVIDYTDGLYYYDVVGEILEKNPSSLKTTTIADSALTWATNRLVEIETGVGLDQLPVLPEEKEVWNEYSTC